MTIDLTQIILAVITLIGALISRYLIPWIKSQLDDRNKEMVATLVRVGVYAAEQLYKSGQGQEKKRYVLELLRKNGYDVNDASVEALIEATVKELEIELQK